MTHILLQYRWNTGAITLKTLHSQNSIKVLDKIFKELSLLAPPILIFQNSHNFGVC